MQMFTMDKSKMIWILEYITHETMQELRNEYQDYFKWYNGLEIIDSPDRIIVFQ